MDKVSHLILFLILCWALSLFGQAATSELNTHGDIEVSRVLDDAPQLKDIVVPGNTVWMWLSDAFNYNKGGIKIYWDPGPTLRAYTFGGETEYLGSSKICFIRIDRKYKTGRWAGVAKESEAILASLVFELENARNVEEVNRLTERAASGEVSRQDFILGSARLEFSAEAGVKSFLYHTWIPYCKSAHLESDQNFWWTCQAETFDDWMKMYPAGSDYPWKIYGSKYDRIVKAAK